jgi:cytochrome c nitrite reductase small subunit
VEPGSRSAKRTLLSEAAGLRLLLALGISLGVALGLGFSTFRYAKGFSYFKTDPSACANCHIMQSQYDGWQKSSHHTAAVCIDCHLPEAFIPKYIAKAENGWRHGKEFTLQTFAEPIALKPRSSEILQDNCVRCHQDLVHDVAAGFAPQVKELSCIHCHQSAGHGTRAALGGPLRAAELAPPSAKSKAHP